MADDENMISEGAEYSPKSEFSKARVVEDAVRKCIDARSKEMVKGYYNYKFDQRGIPLKVWIPDQREVFISSVTALRNLLAPEIKLPKHKAFRTREGNIKKKIKKVFEKYCYTELKQKFIEGKINYEKTNNKYMPNKGEQIIIISIAQNNKLVVKEVIGGWDRQVDFYLDEMVKLNDRLFAALNELIDSLNYFKAQVRF
jgi:hypothetical protein